MSIAAFEDSARSIAGYWQQLLRLSDWDVELHIVKGYLGPQTYASVESDPRSKTAKISLIDPRDWEPESLTGDAVEDTLIHELLHLHFRQVGYAYDEDREEPLVHQLARVLAGIRKT
jgi:hypothetical protein